MNCKGCDPCKFCRYLVPSRGHRYDEPDEPPECARVDDLPDDYDGTTPCPLFASTFVSDDLYWEIQNEKDYLWWLEQQIEREEELTDEQKKDYERLKEVYQ